MSLNPGTVVDFVGAGSHMEFANKGIKMVKKYVLECSTSTFTRKMKIKPILRLN